MSSRREFIMVLGGAAATWPLAARAQQGARMRRKCVTESPNVNGDDRAALLLADPVRLAVHQRRSLVSGPTVSMVPIGPEGPSRSSDRRPSSAGIAPASVG